MEGYLYISNRCSKFQTNMFETRLLGGQKTICMRGEEAARIFYNPDHFIRQGAAPPMVRDTLFGKHAVQTLDDDAHLQRKQLFLDLMKDTSLESITELVREQCRLAIVKWEAKDHVNFFDEVTEILTRAVCRWTGVPLPEKEVEKRRRELVALFDAPASMGPRQLKGRLARNKAEKWIGNKVKQVRSGELSASEDTMLYKVAWHIDADGKLLDTQKAAVELLNILRPVVAIGVYIDFVALALHRYPIEKQKVAEGGEEEAHRFVQEVRRYYPFFPAAVAKVRGDFVWNGHDFMEGDLVLLDLHGTNHHPDLWESPYTFSPDRFKDWTDNGYQLIPQGGGSYPNNHRCPGEWMTIEIMKVSAEMLTKGMDYDVPVQHLHYSMNRIPSLPKSRFIMKDVRLVNN